MDTLNLAAVEPIFNQIDNIAQTREAIKKLQMEYNALIIPKVNNTALLPQIFEWYKEVSVDVDKRDRDSKTMFTQCFVFVVALLYSPQSLAGAKLSLGIREKLTILLKYKSPTSISNFIPNLMFLYKNYHSYRDRVNTAFEHISKKLISNNLL
jgi:hypothetical protein